MGAREAGKRQGPSQTVRFTRLRDAAMGVAKRLRELRVSRGYEQKDVARYLNIPTGDYENWEAGITFPSIFQVEELAALLAASPSYVAFGMTGDKGRMVPVPHLGKGLKQTRKPIRQST